MEHEKSLILVESTTSSIAYINDIHPYTDILESSCSGYTALNTLNGSNYFYQDTTKQSPRNIYIKYNTQYTCNDIPLNQLNTYTENNIQEIDTSDNINVNNPIISVDNNKVKYFVVPESITKDNIKYTINKTPYKYMKSYINSDATMLQKVMEDYLPAYIPSDYNPDSLLSVPSLFIPYKTTYNNIVMLMTTWLQEHPHNPKYYDLLYCSDGDYIAGWSYDITKSGDSDILTINTNCIHYDISSSDVIINCPADGDWPETKSQESVELSCPTGYTGTRTRQCMDGQWQDVNDLCKKIESTDSGVNSSVSSDNTPASTPANNGVSSDNTPASTPTSSSETLIDKLNNLGSLSIANTTIYIWYIIAVCIFIFVLIIIVKVKNRNSDKELIRLLRS